MSRSGTNNGGCGGFGCMPIVQCWRCGFKFHIGNHNPRRECANRVKCNQRQEANARKSGEGREASDDS